MPKFALSRITMESCDKFDVMVTCVTDRVFLLFSKTGPTIRMQPVLHFIRTSILLIQRLQELQISYIIINASTVDLFSSIDNFTGGRGNSSRLTETLLLVDSRVSRLPVLGLVIMSDGTG